MLLISRIMKNKLAHISIIALLLIGNFSLLFGQQNSEADRIYDRLGYKTSIPKYQEGGEMDQAVLEKIATSYRLNHDTENAELWYAQVIEESQNPLDFFYYAQALQSNGRYERAKEYYLIYDEMLGGDRKDQRGKILAEAIDRMNEFQQHNISVKNEALINTNKLDFSPAYYKDGVVFVSTRAIKNMWEDSKDIWIDDNFMSLFYAKINEQGSLEQTEEFSEQLSTQFHEGPVSFTRNGERIFFTRNHFNKGKRKNNSKGIMKLQIYTATKSDGTWSEAVELPFNTVEFEEAHPSIAADGMTLYFTSDRPGGFGGMDIYKSLFQGGTWSEPINLGETVNTPGNELFPFIQDDGTLYFASNGWGGLGGLDIFQTQLDENLNWAKAKNMGKPFNSPKDDFGLVTNITGTEGFFTSARDKGQGKDDIYSFKKTFTPSAFSSQICVYELESGERIEGVRVELREKRPEDDCDLPQDDLTLQLVESGVDRQYLLQLRERVEACQDDAQFNYTTTETGIFNAPLFPNKEYVAIAKKDGYELAKEVFMTPSDFESAKDFEYCIPLKKMDCMAIEGVVKNKKYDKIIPNAAVTMVNLCSGEEFSVQSDRDGAFYFPCVECGCEFKFKGTKNHFIDGKTDLSTLDDGCIIGGKAEVVLELTPGENPASSQDMLASGNYPSTPYPSSSSSNPSTATFAGTELREGAVIELQNIYYDFDQFYIRDDATDDLDKVVSLMQTYPSMIIELASHTDARGSDKYNERLSDNRARKAVEYIIGKGIDSRRLIARGYGENQLRNGCANFVDCTEEEHQNNRRTEIKIVKFDRSDIGVRYIDNKPEKIDRADKKRKYTWN